MSKSPDAFRTISEVADWLDTQAHVLRFWESKFSQVKPIKRAGGRRYYRPQDMLLLGGIKHLLHDQGLTIKGAQQLLREKGVKHVSSLSQALDPDGSDDVSLSLEEKQPDHLVSQRSLLDKDSEPADVGTESTPVESQLETTSEQQIFEEIAIQQLSKSETPDSSEALEPATKDIDVSAEPEAHEITDSPEEQLEASASDEETDTAESAEAVRESKSGLDQTPLTSSETETFALEDEPTNPTPPTPDLFAQTGAEHIASEIPAATHASDQEAVETSEDPAEQEATLAPENVEPIEEFLISLSKSTHIEVQDLPQAAKLVSRLDAFFERAQETDRA